jgi:hypothetical protein
MLQMKVGAQKVAHLDEDDGVAAIAFGGDTSVSPIFEDLVIENDYVNDY